MSWRDSYGAPALMDLPGWALEDVSDETVCHRFAGDAPASACGVPRSEQPEHGASTPTHIARGQSHCPWCGNPICARCRELIR
jgi:hypothetical protein